MICHPIKSHSAVTAGQDCGFLHWMQVTYFHGSPSVPTHNAPQAPSTIAVLDPLEQCVREEVLCARNKELVTSGDHRLDFFNLHARAAEICMLT
jgi:hypothetical protein